MEQGFFELKVISNFAAAHNLREFRGKCENLHGHNWKVEVVLRGKSLQNNGIVVDFGEVKAEVRAILEEMDHRYLNELPAFSTDNPSSENICRFLFEKLSKRLDTDARRLYSVTAWESEDACATYIVE
ncbi:MAG: 6-carboxytetrahydropterin synthase QueD [Syntrophobacteraceae bacterium]|nr:6-carboxytetrahydropterin synthase QueD [Syntrophobacteraceae bacterium]